MIKTMGNVTEQADFINKAVNQIERKHAEIQADINKVVNDQNTLSTKNYNDVFLDDLQDLEMDTELSSQPISITMHGRFMNADDFYGKAWNYLRNAQFQPDIAPMYSNIFGSFSNREVRNAVHSAYCHMPADHWTHFDTKDLQPLNAGKVNIIINDVKRQAKQYGYYIPEKVGMVQL